MNVIQQRLSIAMFLIALSIGIGLGLAMSQSIQKPLESLGVIVVTWVGSLLGVGGMFKSYIRETREEEKIPTLEFGNIYHREMVYFVDVRMKKGEGRVEKCAGYLTVKHSDIINTATVWEHSALREYGVGTHMGLRLFRTQGNSIFFPAALGHQPSGFVENERQLTEFSQKEITVEISVSNGRKPEPYVKTIKDII